jgi:hypothetical protein
VGCWRGLGGGGLPACRERLGRAAARVGLRKGSLEVFWRSRKGRFAGFEIVERVTWALFGRGKGSLRGFSTGRRGHLGGFGEAKRSLGVEFMVRELPYRYGGVDHDRGFAVDAIGRAKDSDIVECLDRIQTIRFCDPRPSLSSVIFFCATKDAPNRSKARFFQCWFPVISLSPLDSPSLAHFSKELAIERHDKCINYGRYVLYLLESDDYTNGPSISLYVKLNGVSAWEKTISVYNPVPELADNFILIEQALERTIVQAYAEILPASPNELFFRRK